MGEADPSQGQNLRNLAAAIFAPPESLLDIAKCLYELLLILIILYILGNVLKDVLYKNVPENTRKRFLAKWLTVDIGLIVALTLAYIFGLWCLILPLVVALVISLGWTLTYSRHDSMRASVKSWYLVGSARAKSMLKEKEVPKEPKEPVGPIKKEVTGGVIVMGPKK